MLPLVLSFPAQAVSRHRASRRDRVGLHETVQGLQADPHPTVAPVQVHRPGGHGLLLRWVEHWPGLLENTDTPGKGYCRLRVQASTSSSPPGDGSEGRGSSRTGNHLTQGTLAGHASSSLLQTPVSLPLESPQPVGGCSTATRASFCRHGPFWKRLQEGDLGQQSHPAPGHCPTRHSSSA